MKDKHRILSDKQIRELLDDAKLDAIQQTMILAAGYLMDDWGYDPGKILGFWEGVSRYADAKNDHLLTMNKVCDIINDKTGLNIHWRR